MIIRTLSRVGAAFFLAGLTVACSTSGSRSSHSFFNACTFSFGDCMYEGPYEAGEDEYAEEEAKRLNRAQIERLKQQSM